MNLKKKFDVITQAGLRFQKNLCELGHKCTEDSKRLRVVLCAFAPLRESKLRETSFSQRRKGAKVAKAILRDERLRLNFVVFAVVAVSLSFANACAEAPGKSSDVYMGSRPASLAAGEPEPPRVYLDTTYTPPKGRSIVDFDGGQTSLSQIPHDLIVDRCYIHGNPSDTSRRGVALNSASTAVIDSYISECHESGADSQAIAGCNGPGPFKIVNNYLEGAGENFILGGADPSVQNLIPSDIEFRHNQVAKPVKWKVGHPSYAGIRWSVKNLLELKNAQRVLIESNVFEYNWAESQNGFAILFTPRNQSGHSPWSVAQDVTFANNTLRHSGSGFNIAGPDNEAGVSQPSRRILIRNNLIEDIDGKAWEGDGRLFQIVGGAEYITIDHNTGFASGNILSTDSTQGLNVGLVFTNNIVAHNAYGVLGTDTGIGLSTLNRWWKSYVFKKNVIVGGKASNYPPDNYFISSFSEVGFVDMAKGDYRLSSSSSYQNAGADGKNIGCSLNKTHR